MAAAPGGATEAAFMASFEAATYATYHEAAGKSEEEVASFGKGAIMLPSLRSGAALLGALAWLLAVIARPYVVVGGAMLWCVQRLAGAPWPPPPEAHALKRWWWWGWLVLAAWQAFASRARRSPRTDARLGAAPHGCVTEPGWYFDASNTAMVKLVGALRTRGDYASVGTPWLLSGDIRTLLPFVLFSAPTHTYHRRWLRVPLSYGPNGPWDSELLRPCAAAAAATDGKAAAGEEFEAVAVDVLLAPPPSPDSGGGAKKAFAYDPGRPLVLLLAGLTGGSDEGYLNDMVHDAVFNRYAPS